MLPPGVERRRHPDKGHALYATTPFAPGDTILSVSSLLLIPSLDNINTHCSFCLSAPSSLSVCTRCRSVYYCGKVCQRNAWRSVHSRECPALARAHESAIQREVRGRTGLPTPVRLLIQALLFQEIGNVILTLEGHEGVVFGDDKVKNQKEKEDIEMMARAACYYAGLGSGSAVVSKAVSLLHKIRINAFNYSSSSAGDVGVFVDPDLAMLNHSCLPNAMVQIVGNTAILRTGTALKTGDEIQISYIDYTWPLSGRRKALEAYKFTCKCLRCEENLSVYEAAVISSAANLNLHTLAPELCNVSHHRGVTDSSFATTESDKATMGIDLAKLQSISVKEAWARYRRSSVLVENNLWALGPLLSALKRIEEELIDRMEFTAALSVSCLIATKLEPYFYVTPFHPVRIEKLLVLAKLLMVTPEDRASHSDSDRTISDIPDVPYDFRPVKDVLEKIDQVIFCHMLMTMVQRFAPTGLDEWEVILTTKEILGDIMKVPDRGMDMMLVNNWKEHPERPESREFFIHAVLDPIQRFAKAGEEFLKANCEKYED